MKKLGITIVTFLFLGVGGFLSAYFYLNRDVVTTRFPTHADAQQAGAFARGWLPPVLPSSSKNIFEINNLDINTGRGSFDFEPREIESYLDVLAKDFGAVVIREEKQRQARFSRDKTSWIIVLPNDGVNATYTVKPQ